MGAMGASRKLQLLESDKGSFYNQVNWIEEYEYDKGLYYNNYGDYFDEESDESDSDIDSENGNDSDCESDRNSKNNITSERNIIVSIKTLQSLIHRFASSRYRNIFNGQKSLKSAGVKTNNLLDADG